MRVRDTVAILCLAFGTSCSGIVTEDDFDGDVNATLIAIVDVNLVPMDRNGTLPSQTVLIEDGRITSIGPASTSQIPSGALRINGSGKYLIPGLIDMHVHIRASDLEQYLRAGVTSVRNMWGYEGLPDLIGDVDSRAKRGPRIFSLTAGFDGSPASAPQTQIVDEPAAVAALIERQYDLGFREVKVYDKISRASYDSIVSVSRRKGMTWAGHIPTAVGLTRAVAAGQHSVEHLGGYGTGVTLTTQIEATVSAGAYNCPTLVVLAMFSTAQQAAGQRALTAALFNAGARLLVGTDAGIGYTQPGSSIHDELELFVKSGLTPFDALLAATRTGAEYLGQKSAIGTIEVGKEADLVLLESNPLTDIRSTRNIIALILDGRLLQ